MSVSRLLETTRVTLHQQLASAASADREVSAVISDNEGHDREVVAAEQAPCQTRGEPTPAFAASPSDKGLPEQGPVLTDPGAAPPLAVVPHKPGRGRGATPPGVCGKAVGSSLWVCTSPFSNHILHKIDFVRRRGTAHMPRPTRYSGLAWSVLWLGS